MKTYSIRKISSIALASCILVSLTGCPLHMPVSKPTIDQDTAEEDLRDEIKVTDWNGEVPDGMEIMYVCNRTIRLNYEQHRDEKLYEHDGFGRVTATVSVEEKGTKRLQLTYNDDGTIAEKKYVKDGNFMGYQIPDYTTEYTYNDKGQLTAYSKVMINLSGNETKKAAEFEYENGHLVRINGMEDDIDDMEYDYNFDTLPYYEFVVEVDDTDADYFVIKNYYDENNLLTASEKGEIRTTYEYENGVLTGWSQTNFHNNNSNSVSYYNAEGTLLYIENGKGELWIRNTLNDHGDIILYESWKNGELDEKHSSEYEYDADGNIVTEVTEYWSKNNDGEEESFTSVHTYEYEEHGLLISEVDMIGEKFMSMTVYSYEAILVPQT